ncbi:hypothetical protein [Streptomyces subrutilus]|uniref:hypothetical protein n=1 Tax=Streptomyces subrutilus TaxID=36818 RepID=UPI0033D8EDAC
MSIEPEVRRGGGLPFGQVVSQWVCDPRYTTNLRTLYTILVTYADIGARDTGKGKPYRAELAGQLGCSLKTLDRTILEGECAALFWVEKRTDPKNPNLNDASVYHLRDAEFWRGEWSDPLKAGQTAAEAAAEVVAARVKAKREAGIMPKGGVPKGTKRKKEAAPEGGVASPMTPPSDGGGGVMGDARGGVTHDATVASPMTPTVYSPVENPFRDDSEPSVRPCLKVSARDEIGSGTDGRTDGGGELVEDQEQLPLAWGAAADAAPLNGGNTAKAPTGAGPGSPVAGVPAECASVPSTAGVLLLAEIGGWHPEYLVTGQTLADQGRVVTGMLADGWKASSIRQVITGRPLPVPMTHTVGAVIAARLRQAAAGPVPSPTASWGSIPPQGRPAENPVDHSSSAVAGRTVAEALDHRVRYECVDCGRVRDTGFDVCGACAGWPACATGCGRHLEHGGICPACAEAAEYAGIPAHATDDGTCPGHDGPCGRPVLTLGLCGKCRVAVEMAKRETDAEWEAARTAAIAAVQEAGTEQLASTAPC